MKAYRLLETGYDLKSQFSRCASHALADTTRRLCMSVNSCQIDTRSIYDNLRSILKHFANSPRSSKLLNNARHEQHTLTQLGFCKNGWLSRHMCLGMFNKTRRDKHNMFQLLPKSCTVTKKTRLNLCDNN